MVSPKQSEIDDMFERYYREDIETDIDLQLAMLDEKRRKEALHNHVFNTTQDNLSKLKKKDGTPRKVGDVRKYGVVKYNRKWFMEKAVETAQKGVLGIAEKALKPSSFDKFKKKKKVENVARMIKYEWKGHPAIGFYDKKGKVLSWGKDMDRKEWESLSIETSKKVKK